MLTAELKNWQGEKICQKTVEALKQRGFTAFYLENSAKASEFILESAASAETIGCGGSLSLSEMGIYEKLLALGKTVLDHCASNLSKEEKMRIRKAQLTSDLFLSGINALTKDGEIVNIDGVGNRVSAMIFGPKKVLLVAGRNKIVAGSIGDALARIRKIAAPQNCKRLGRQTPCAITGECADCQSPERICRVTTIISFPPLATDLTVLVVNEDLGF